MLVVVATTPAHLLRWATVYVLILIAETLIARLPLPGLLLRACIVLPFTGTFAVITWLAGDPQRAAALAIKSYLSAVAVLLLKTGIIEMNEYERSLLDIIAGRRRSRPRVKPRRWEE